MLFYVFVAFVGLNNNTILAMRNIEFGSVSSDRYPNPAENANIEAILILNIGSAHPYSKDWLLSNITPRFFTVEEVTVHPSSCKL